MGKKDTLKWKLVLVRFVDSCGTGQDEGAKQQNETESYILIFIYLYNYL